MDLLTREDIPTHFWITHEKLLLSCLREKLICILSIFFLNNFSWWHFLLPICDQEMGYYEFLNRLPWSPPVVRYQSSTKFVLSSFQLWVLRRLRYAFFSSFLTKKICTEFIAVLTIRIVWVICSLVFMQLYRSPTQQTHWKIPYYALWKMIQAK